MGLWQYSRFGHGEDVVSSPKVSVLGQFFCRFRFFLFFSVHRSTPTWDTSAMHCIASSSTSTSSIQIRDDLGVKADFRFVMTTRKTPFRRRQFRRRSESTTNPSLFFRKQPKSFLWAAAKCQDINSLGSTSHGCVNFWRIFKPWIIQNGHGYDLLLLQYPPGLPKEEKHKIHQKKGCVSNSKSQERLLMLSWGLTFCWKDRKISKNHHTCQLPWTSRKEKTTTTKDPEETPPPREVGRDFGSWKRPMACVRACVRKWTWKLDVRAFLWWACRCLPARFCASHTHIRSSESNIQNKYYRRRITKSEGKGMTWSYHSVVRVRVVALV